MHKRIIILLTLAIMVFAASASAWEQSFRAATSDMLFWGDFDNDLDPIYIHDNQGYRFYSILSNLTGGYNMFLNDYYGADDHTFLMGASGQFGLPTKFPWESRTSFVIQLADQTYSRSSGLDLDLNGVINGDENTDGEASGTRVSDESWDTDSARYFFSTTNTASANAYTLMKERNWQLTHSYTDGSKTIGFSFKHNGYGDNYYEDDRYYDSPIYFGFNNFSTSLGFSELDPQFFFSYNNSETYYDMTQPTSRLLWRKMRVGDFQNWGKNPSNDILVSFQMPFTPITNSEIRFDLNYSKETNDWGSDWMTEWVDYYSDSTGGFWGQDSLRETESIMADGKYGGSIFHPGVQLTKNWSPETYSWFRFDVAFGSSDNITNGTRTYNYRNHSVAGDYLDTRMEKETVNIDGSNDQSMFSFYHKTVHEFSPNFRFAAGLNFATSKEELKDAPFTYTRTTQSEYIDTWSANPNLNEVADYRTSSYTQSSGTVTQTYKYTGAMFPVALEYVQGKWTFRLGGVHQIYKSTYESEWIQNGHPVYADSLILGDGTVTVSDQPDDSYDTRNQKEEYKNYSNSFYYGLQFMPNPNMKIELIDFLTDYVTKSTGLSFIDTQYFSNLRMSITILW